MVSTYSNIDVGDYNQIQGRPVTQNIQQYKLDTGLPTIDEVVSGGSGQVKGASDKREEKKGGYDKGAAAESLGLTKDMLDAIAQGYGYDSTEDFLKSDIRKQIDEAFSGVEKFLDKARSVYTEQQPGIEEDIRSLFGQAEAGVRQEESTTERELSRQETEGKQRKENALTEASRLYNEILQGGRQRFGQSSSAGEAFQAIAGRELQRESAGVREQFQSFMSQVENARVSLRERVSNALQEIKVQTAIKVNEARRDFQNKLLEVDRLETENEGAKANMKLEALQNLRNQVFQINLAEAQNTQALQDSAKQTEDMLSNLINQNQYSTKGIGPADESIQGVSAGMDVGNAAGTGDQMAAVGIRTPRRDDEELFNAGDFGVNPLSGSATRY